MVNMSSKISRSGKAVAEMYSKLSKNKKVFVQCAAAALIVGLPEVALAQSAGAGANFFCYIAQYFKQIVGSAALVAIFMWALEHIFGMSKLHDIVIKVGIACAIVIGGAALITNSGLTVSCVV
jgi:hypothetical protein